MIPLSDSIVHLIGLLVAAFLAYVGIVNKNASKDVSLICQKIDAKIETHLAVDEQVHGEIDRRLNRLEGSPR